MEDMEDLEALEDESTPWGYLGALARDILVKATLPMECRNDKENEMLTLLKEIVFLCDWRGLPGEENIDIIHLKKLSEKYGCKKIAKAIEKLNKLKYNSFRRILLEQKIVYMLNDKKCEPMWREAFDNIVESQKMYSNNEDICVEYEITQEIRQDIPEFVDKRPIYYGIATSMSGVVSIFLVMGLTFSVFYILGMMLMEAVLAFIFGKVEVIPSMIMDYPWWKTLLFIWIAFIGVICGIIGVVAWKTKRK